MVTMPLSMILAMDAWRLSGTEHTFFVSVCAPWAPSEEPKVDACTFSTNPQGGKSDISFLA
jgi:hypothetical protein